MSDYHPLARRLVAALVENGEVLDQELKDKTAEEVIAATLSTWAASHGAESPAWVKEGRHPTMAEAVAMWPEDRDAGVLMHAYRAGIAKGLRDAEMAEVPESESPGRCVDPSMWFLDGIAAHKKAIRALQEKEGEGDPS